jgi:outer membrane protein assembly factor BamD (BamD/ComL family)
MSSQFQQFQQEFQQLGQDLSSGNISAAQSDFVTLQNDMPQANSASNSTSTSQSNNPIAQAFNQLAQDLQSGNLSAAQKDYATIQQDFKSQASQMHHHHKSSGSQQSEVSQMLDQLGQDLQSGNLSNAQSDFSSLQTLLEKYTSSGTSTGSTSSGLSINA